MSRPLLDVRDLRVAFPACRHGTLPWKKQLQLHALSGVDLFLNQGETLGVVGESGCGKSTLARALIGLVPATGRAEWEDGCNLIGLSSRRMLKYRSQIQMIFQDPLASLDPRMTVGQIIAEPLVTHRTDLSWTEVMGRVRESMEAVGLLPNQINRYPHEFSGGQCQRIGIARALIMRPKLIICDEPVSALDVSIQAQIINLLMRLSKDLGLSLVFIAHDLSVVRHLSDRVMVLYLGKVMETGSTGDIFLNPQHPYTQALLSAVPVVRPHQHPALRAMPLRGDLPSPVNPPSGCVFRTRCPRARPRCAAEIPLLVGDEHQTACHFPGTLTPQETSKARYDVA